MSLIIACATCQRKLNVRDELIGKRVKCPGCGGVISVPADTADEPPKPVEPDASPNEEYADRGERRTKKRKQKKARREAEPLFTLNGVEFSPVKALCLGGAVLGAIAVVVLLFVFTPLGSMFSSESEVEVVDVYTAVNSMGFGGLAGAAMQKKMDTYVMPGPRKIVVTRPNAEGEFIIVTVKISNQELETYFKGARGAISLSPGAIQLQTGGEKIIAEFVQDKNEKPAEGYELGYALSPLAKDGPSLEECLGPKPGGWTHPGQKADGDRSITFTGSTGMEVTARFGIDRRRRGTTAEDLIQVTWNTGSTGWIIATDVEQPNDISRTWNVRCMFPRPKGVKEATLIVMGQTRPLKLP